MAPSIYEKSQICKSRFKRLLASASSDFQTNNDRLRDEFDKYSIWADSHGANHPPTSSRSLDHRLRFASPYKEEILRILDIIASQLDTDVHERLEGTHDRRKQVKQLDPQVDDTTSEGSESPWEVSSGSESENDLDHLVPGTNKGAVVVGTTAQQVLEATQLAIKCLYLIPLRKPAPMDRLKDKFIGSRKPLPHSTYDQLYVRDKFPALDPLVQARLAKMITRRRELLEYRRQHNQKLAFMPTDFVDAEALDESSQDAENIDDAANDDIAVGHVKGNIARPPGGPLTEYTKATTVRIDPNSLPHLFEDGFAEMQSATRSVFEDDTRTSVAGSIATRELKIEVPLRPKQSDGTFARLFKCNYCHLPVQIESDRAWREHVLADLQPFVCTYPGCQLEDYLFDDVDAWYRHESEYHRVELFCKILGHAAYTTQSDFREHLKHDHNLVLEPSAAADELHTFQRPLKALSGICNLCQGHSSNLKRHVSRHLRQVALFALPRADYYAGDDEGNSEEGDQSLKAIGYSTGNHSSASSSEPAWTLSSRSTRSTTNSATQADDDGLPRPDPETWAPDTSIPPNSEPISWDEVGTYGVVKAREGESSERTPLTWTSLYEQEIPEPREVPLSQLLASGDQDVLNRLDLGPAVGLLIKESKVSGSKAV